MKKNTLINILIVLLNITACVSFTVMAFMYSNSFGFFIIGTLSFLYTIILIIYKDEKND